MDAEPSNQQNTLSNRQNMQSPLFDSTAHFKPKPLAQCILTQPTDERSASSAEIARETSRVSRSRGFSVCVPEPEPQPRPIRCAVKKAAIARFYITSPSDFELLIERPLACAIAAVLSSLCHPRSRLYPRKPPSPRQDPPSVNHDPLAEPSGGVPTWSSDMVLRSCGSVGGLMTTEFRGPSASIRSRSARPRAWGISRGRGTRRKNAPA